MSDGKTTGLGVDAHGGPVIDPTENVIALTKAEAKRQDDLRVAERELTDAKLAHVKEIGKLRAAHQHQLDEAESKRLDSIRQVDREEVIKTAAAVVATAETLRAQVQSAALAQATQFGAFQGEVLKRLSNVEITLSASGAGTAGEKSGRVSQQQLIQYFIYLILAAIIIGGAVIGIAFAIKKP